MNLNLVKELIEFLNKNNLLELEVGYEDLKIKVGRVTDPKDALTSEKAYINSEKEEKDASDVSADNLIKVVSPLAGVFYRQSKPGVAPFVDIGDVVSVGQTLCIIEAMKLMNEITAESEGKIVDIEVENGQVVEPGKILFLMEPVKT